MTVLTQQLSDPVTETVVSRHSLPGVGTFEFERDHTSGALVGLRGGGRDWFFCEVDHGGARG